MRKEIHIVTGIIGTTVSVLEYLVVGNLPLALSIGLITIISNIYFHLISEWRYYKRHQAVIASSQFLLIPYVGILLSNYLGGLGLMMIIYSSTALLRLEINIFSLIIF